jgi:hypothetical protein
MLRPACHAYGKFGSVACMHVLSSFPISEKTGKRLHPPSIGAPPRNDLGKWLQELELFAFGLGEYLVRELMRPDRKRVYVVSCCLGVLVRSCRHHVVAHREEDQKPMRRYLVGRWAHKYLFILWRKWATRYMNYTPFEMSDVTHSVEGDTPRRK